MARPAKDDAKNPRFVRPRLWVLPMRQPWAELVLSGQKTLCIEEHQPDLRGWVLLHAGKTVDLDAVPVLREHGALVPSPLPTGALVGVVHLAGVRWVTDTSEDLCAALGTSELPEQLAYDLFGFYATSGKKLPRFAWGLAHPLRIEPIAIAGRGRRWALPPKLNATVRREVLRHAGQIPALPTP